ncbi:MAG: head completion/stabilization protein [Rhodospirillaceae bacterium]|nr:head completion/stabilization protein [Rhodospirillales bacterium]
MSSTAFIPSNNPGATPATVANDGWFPNLDIDDFKAQTGHGDVFSTARLSAVVQAAMIEVNASIAAWRSAQTAATLALVPATMYGDTSEKIVLYRTAVFARARAQLLDTTRDYDSTKTGHGRADALEDTAAKYLQQSTEALARLTGRARMVVELI